MSSVLNTCVDSDWLSVVFFKARQLEKNIESDFSDVVVIVVTL